MKNNITYTNKLKELIEEVSPTSTDAFEDFLSICDTNIDSREVAIFIINEMKVVSLLLDNLSLSRINRCVKKLKNNNTEIYDNYKKSKLPYECYYTITDDLKSFLDKIYILEKKVSKSINKSENLTKLIYSCVIIEPNLLCYDIIIEYSKNEEFFKSKSDKIRSSLLAEFLKFTNFPKFEKSSKYLTVLTDPQCTDNCFCRDMEIEQVINTLCRVKKCNPLLIGNPGTGKTAIVEGLAYKIVNGLITNNYLKDKHIVQLNLTSMLAGAKYRGDFEERLQTCMEEVIKCGDVILFIDEIHTITDAGGSEGAITASNIIKPYLARNKIKLIGATTLKEVKMIEKDKALYRRFKPIKVDEPSIESTKDILKNRIDIYEKHHQIKIPTTCIDFIVEQCDIYYPDKYYPDKAFDLLDDSCIQCVNSNDTVLTQNHINKTLEFCTHIPNHNKKIDFNKIEQVINSKLIGQHESVKTVLNIIKRNTMLVTLQNKPRASFLFVGPTGTGKTQLCKYIAEELYTKESFIRLDMSEFMEKHSVSKIIGSPPGYVGFEEKGQLTEKVKYNPYSVILFDEIEKAHKDVLNLLLQILDDAILTDSYGDTVDFKHCVIILTSNIGVDSLNKSIGFNTISNKEIYTTAIKQFFSPEFINRLDSIVTFDFLQKSEINQLIKLYLNDLLSNIKSNCTITYSDELVAWLGDKCYNKEYGARYVQRELKNIVLDKIIDLIYENNEQQTICMDIVDNEFVCKQTLLQS